MAQCLPRMREQGRHVRIEDALVRYTVACFDDGRGRRYRDTVQNGDKYFAFTKHVAAEPIKQEVRVANPELAHELKTHVEQCAARKQVPEGSALLNIIASYFETDIKRNAGLDQMDLLSFQLQGKSAKDLQEFVRKSNYALHGFMAAGETRAHPDTHHGQGPRVKELEQAPNLRALVDQHI